MFDLHLAPIDRLHGLDFRRARPAAETSSSRRPQNVFGQH